MKISGQGITEGHVSPWKRLRLACLRLNLAVPGGQDGPTLPSHPTGRAACSTPGWGMRRRKGKGSLANFCRVFGLLCLLKNLPRKIHVSLILAGVFEGEGEEKKLAAISCLMADSALGRMCVLGCLRCTASP